MKKNDYHLFYAVRRVSGRPGAFQEERVWLVGGRAVGPRKRVTQEELEKLFELEDEAESWSPVGTLAAECLPNVPPSVALVPFARRAFQQAGPSCWKWALAGLTDLWPSRSVSRQFLIRINRARSLAPDMTRKGKRFKMVLTFALKDVGDALAMSTAFGIWVGRLRLCKKCRRRLFVAPDTRPKQLTCGQCRREGQVRRPYTKLGVKDPRRPHLRCLQCRLATQVNRGTLTPAERDKLLGLAKEDLQRLPVSEWWVKWDRQTRLPRGRASRGAHKVTTYGALLDVKEQGPRDYHI